MRVFMTMAIFLSFCILSKLFSYATMANLVLWSRQFFLCIMAFFGVQTMAIFLRPRQFIFEQISKFHTNHGNLFPVARQLFRFLYIMEVFARCHPSWRFSFYVGTV